MFRQTYHYACFTCRVSSKYHVHHSCGAPLVPMGKDFKAPRKDDIAQWKKLALAINGTRQHHPNCVYSDKKRIGVVREPRCWSWCSCPYLPNFKTVADVKSGYGLRRSREKVYADPVPVRGHRRPRYRFGRY